MQNEYIRFLIEIDKLEYSSISIVYSIYEIIIEIYGRLRDSLEMYAYITSLIDTMI